MLRGTRTLPHVGNHPGTYCLLWLIGFGVLAGAKSGGLAGALAGLAVMSLGVGPIYLWGAYDRTRLSDALEEREVSSKQNAPQSGAFK